MSMQFVDLNAPSLQGKLPKCPQELPHGLIEPPPRVVEIVEQERVKCPPEIFTALAEERLRNDLTLQYYFDYLGYEVAYRSTPRGPEVLAVGDQELAPLRRMLNGQPEFKLWQPS